MRANCVPTRNISYYCAAHLGYLLIVVAFRIRSFGPCGFPSYGLGHGPNDTQRLCGFCSAYALQRFTAGMSHSRSEPMTLSEPSNLSDILHVQINSKAGVFKPALQRQNHGLGHAGIGKPGVYIKVKTESRIARQTHHAAIDHKDIGTRHPDVSTYVRRARDI